MVLTDGGSESISRNDKRDTGNGNVDPRLFSSRLPHSDSLRWYTVSPNTDPWVSAVSSPQADCPAAKPVIMPGLTSYTFLLVMPIITRADRIAVRG